jgi:outer membrane murein-binding lipoprotein Lpp
VRRLALLLAAVALAVVAAGCGSDNKAANAYVDAVNRAQNDFASTFDRLSSKITSTSTPEQDQKTLDGFKRAVDKVVGDLRAVEPPDRVKGLHAELVGEIANYGREIDKAKSAFANGSPKAIIKAQTQLVTAVTRVSSQINRTIDAINKKLRE